MGNPPQNKIIYETVESISHCKCDGNRECYGLCTIIMAGMSKVIESDQKGVLGIRRLGAESCPRCDVAQHIISEHCNRSEH